MQYGQTSPPQQGAGEHFEEWTGYTTSAGIAFGAPDDRITGAYSVQQPDAQPSAACAADDAD